MKTSNTDIDNSLCRDVVRALLIAMKNGIFYKAEHPLCISSIKKFMSRLNLWFLSNEILQIDVSQHELFINKNSFGQHESQSGEVAQYFHNRGILSITMSTKVNTGELADFFNIICSDAKTLRDKGGVLKCLPAKSSIKVKELDYSYFLSYSADDLSSKEEEIWKSLFNIADKTAEEKLPESKIEFILDFFKDTKKSARLLNKVYKHGLNQLSGEKVAGNIKKAISQICRFLKDQPEKEKREGQINIMSILFQLHIDLLTSLFEKTAGDSPQKSLSDEIMSNFSDSDIADFIASLILSEGSLNERLLRIFDKLIPDMSKSKRIIPLVADQLFSQNHMHPFKMEPLQISIKEIFKNNTKSCFMNQMYEITVDAVINRKIDTLTYMVNLTPEISRFVQSMRAEKMNREYVRLILNLLYLENDIRDFKKLNRNISTLFPNLLKQKDIASIQDIYVFYTEKIHSEQKSNYQMSREIDKVVEQITQKKVVQTIVSFIPKFDGNNLQYIGNILQKVKKKSVPLLLNDYLKMSGSFNRIKYRKIFFVMKDEISEEISKRLVSSVSYEIKVLFPLLNFYSPEKARNLVESIIKSKDNQILFSILDNYVPATQKEINRVYNIYLKNKDREVKKKAAAVLLKTKDEKVIGDLFQKSDRFLSVRPLLLYNVQICGQIRLHESYPYLADIFMKKTFLPSRKNDEIRLAAAYSLLKLDNPNRFQLISSNIDRGGRYFKRKCRQIFGKYEANKEEDNDS